MPKFIGKITRDDASDFKLVDGQDVNIRSAVDLTSATLADGDFLLLDDITVSSSDSDGTEASTGRVTLSQIKTYIETGNLDITGDISAAGGDFTITNALNAGGLIVKGSEDNNAAIELWADEGDDAADKWQIESAASDNKLYFYSYESGDWVGKLIITTAGVVTTGGDLYVGGNDVIMAAPSAATLKVQASSGTDTAGGNLTISAGQGTGTGNGGDIIFQVADGAGGSGTGVNSLATALTIFDDKSATFTANVTATQFNGDLSGIASKATSFHNITTDTSTDSTHYLVFVDGATATESPALDTGLTYNPSSGLLTADGFAGALTGTASNVTVSDSTADTNFPVVFHDESNALLDDTGALRYNPSTGTLLVTNLSVSGTTTQVNTVTMEAQNAVVFEGATPDDHETTLSIVDPTADHTQYLINQGGYIPLLSAATTTQISATPEELNVLNGVTAGTVTASKGVVVDSNKDITGFNEITSTSFVGSLTGNATTVTNGVYTTSKISVLAATSSSELAGVISDETGSGALVFGSSATLSSPIINGGIALKNGNTSAGFLYFYEDSDNGTNKVTLLGPASTDDVTINLPSTAGTLLTEFTVAASTNTNPTTIVAGDTLTIAAGNGILTTATSDGTITVANGMITALVNYVNKTQAQSISGTKTFVKNETTVNDSDIYPLKSEINYSGNTAYSKTVNNVGFNIDVNHTGVTAYEGTTKNYGLNFDVNSSTGGHHSLSDIFNYGIKGVLTGNTNGDHRQYGIDLTVTGADLSNQIGILLNTQDGSTDLKIVSSADTGDYFTITTTTHGATTIATEDDDAAAAHLTLDVDGHVEFDNCAVGFDKLAGAFSTSGVIGDGNDSTDIDFRLSNKYELELTDNISGLGEFINLIFPNTSGNFLLVLSQDGTGSRTVASAGWVVYQSDGGTKATNAAFADGTDGDVRWSGGSAPTLTTTANKADIISFYWDADNQTCFATASLNF